MLTTETQKLWDVYVQAEKDRIRSVTMPALEQFIESLLGHQSTDNWQGWARELARQASEDQLETPIRFPLFERVLLPALMEGVLLEKPGCARWLAHFEQSLFHCEHPKLPSHLQSAVGLLREAIRVDPTDRLARSRLVKKWANYLEYTLHEIPAGVLYGHNGPSVPECDELLELLDEFRSHVEFLGETAAFSELTRNCQMHFESYREYLLTRASGDHYQGFLERRRPTGI